MMCVSFGMDGISFILDEVAAFYSIVMHGKGRESISKMQLYRHRTSVIPSPISELKS